MNLLATTNLPTGERISAKGSTPCATALLERIVSTITPRTMNTSGTQIGTSALSANTIHRVSSTIRSPAISNSAPNRLVSPRLRATYPSSASDTKIKMIRKKLANCHGVGCWYMSQTTMKSSSRRLSVTRFAIGGLYERLRDPKPRGRRPCQVRRVHWPRILEGNRHEVLRLSKRAEPPQGQAVHRRERARHPDAASRPALAGAAPARLPCQESERRRAVARARRRHVLERKPRDLSLPRAAPSAAESH